ncbi:MAG: putative transporter ATP-binding protein, partial [Acidimicrobiia bacterium]|nr:putative transporter ATP-binding protein [Acidimicrobiia bacterium]
MLLSPQPAPAGIVADHLTKRYGDKAAVDDVTLHVAPGEVVALLGPNGAGKSTTIDMLLGLTPPDDGSVTLWGRSPTDACRSGMVGAMLQSGGLLGGVSVAEMIQLVRRLSPSPLPVDHIYELARVAELADTRADRLSGGEVQRVRFALAIAGNPELLVLDEPTVAMDVATRRSFWEAMHEWT